MKKGNKQVKIFFVEKKSEGSEETAIVSERNSASIATKMGLMPLIAPFVAEQEAKLREYQYIFNNNYLVDVPTILVEGETDIDYLKFVIKQRSPSLKAMLENETLRIICKNDGAGCKQLSNWIIAWIYSGFSSPMIAIFDKDEAGKLAKDEVINSEHYKNKPQSSSIKLMVLEPSEEIIDAYKLNIDVEYEIENLFSDKVWATWAKKKYVEIRSDTTLFKSLINVVSRDKSIEEVINDLKNKGLKEHVFLYEPKEKRKKNMVKCLQENFEGDVSVTVGFKRTIDVIEEFFIK